MQEPQPFGKLLPGLGMDRAGGDIGETGAVRLDHPPARMAQARVDPENTEPAAILIPWS